MYHKSFDLTVVMSIVVVAMLLQLLGIHSPTAQAILGVALVFILPGYALTIALFPRATLDLPEQMLFTLGLSLAVATAAGLILNTTAVGLVPGSWLLMLGSVTLGASLVGMIRRPTVRVTTSSGQRPRWKIGNILMLGVAAVMVVLAVVQATRGAAQQPTPSLTQLWILPDAAANQMVVRLGLRSMEATDVSYKLQVVVGGSVVREWPSMLLQPGETWEVPIELPVVSDRADSVEAILYRADQPEQVYRRVVLRRMT